MKRLILILLMVAAIAGCNTNSEKKKDQNNNDPAFSGTTKITKVVGIGKVEPEDEIVKLASPSGGIVAEVYKKEGDRITKGEPVIRLDDDLEHIRISEISSQVATQKAQLESDKISLETAINRMENRKRFLESTRSLAAKGAETMQNLDDIETDFKSLALAAESAKASVSMSESRLHDLEAQLLYSETEASKKTVKAPCDGIILSMNTTKGSSVGALSTFADFAPSGRKIVRAEVDELYAGLLTNGMPVNIRYSGSDSTLTSGKIFFLSPYLRTKSLFTGKADEQEDRLVRVVKISLDNENDIILNSKVECVISLNGQTQ